MTLASVVIRKKIFVAALESMHFCIVNSFDSINVELFMISNVHSNDALKGVGHGDINDD